MPGNLPWKTQHNTTQQKTNNGAATLAVPPAHCPISKCGCPHLGTMARSWRSIVKVPAALVAPRVLLLGVLIATILLQRLGRTRLSPAPQVLRCGGTDGVGYSGLEGWRRV